MLRPFARVLGVDGTGGKLRDGSSVQGRAGHGGLRSDHGQKIRPGAERLLEEIDGRPPLPARLEAQGLKEVSALGGGRMDETAEFLHRWRVAASGRKSKGGFRNRTLRDAMRI